MQRDAGVLQLESVTRVLQEPGQPVRRKELREEGREEGARGEEREERRDKPRATRSELQPNNSIFSVAFRAKRLNRSFKASIRLPIRRGREMLPL